MNNYQVIKPKLMLTGSYWKSTFLIIQLQECIDLISDSAAVIHVVWDRSAPLQQVMQLTLIVYSCQYLNTWSADTFRCFSDMGQAFWYKNYHSFMIMIYTVFKYIKEM